MFERSVCVPSGGLSASQEFPGRGDVPTLRHELIDSQVLNAFLHAQFIVQEMVGKSSSAHIEPVNANSIAVTVRTNKSHLQIRLGGPVNGGLRLQAHNEFDDNSKVQLRSEESNSSCQIPVSSVMILQVYCSNMQSRTLVFMVFAAAMLFSLVREYSAPVGCPRLEIRRK
jgi:hypothetical protein